MSTPSRSINPDLYTKRDLLVPAGVTGLMFGLALLRHMTLEGALILAALVAAVMFTNALSRRVSIDGPTFKLRKFWHWDGVRLDRLCRIESVDVGRGDWRIVLHDRDGKRVTIDDDVARTDAEIWRELQSAFFAADARGDLTVDERGRQFFNRPAFR